MKFEVGKVYRWSTGNIKARCLAITSAGFGLGEITENCSSNYKKGDPCEMKYANSWHEVIEPKRGTVWVNVYDNGGNLNYNSRDEADRYALRERIA